MFKQLNRSSLTNNNNNNNKKCVKHITPEIRPDVLCELSLHEFFRLTNRVSNIQLSMSCDFLKEKYNPKHNDASSVLTKAVKDANMGNLSAGESCCKCFSLCIVSLFSLPFVDLETMLC